MTLLDTQIRLAASLVPRASRADRARAARLIAQNARIPAELALEIYRNNVSGALTKALTAAYPACLSVLGESCFNAVADLFIAQTPSDQPDLNRYDRRFGDFLDDWVDTQTSLSDYRYLGDLARLEWLCHRAYYAADDVPFDFAAFARLQTEARATLRFRLGHCEGLLRSTYPVMEIRDINLPHSAETGVRVGELPEHLVVWRPQGLAKVQCVDATTFQVLTACRDGKTLGQLAQIGGPEGKTLAEVLPNLIQCRLLSGFSLAAPGPKRDSVDA